MKRKIILTGSNSRSVTEEYVQLYDSIQTELKEITTSYMRIKCKYYYYLNRPHLNESKLEEYEITKRIYQGSLQVKKAIKSNELRGKISREDLKSVINQFQENYFKFQNYNFVGRILPTVVEEKEDSYNSDELTNTPIEFENEQELSKEYLEGDDGPFSEDDDPIKKVRTEITDEPIRWI